MKVAVLGASGFIGGAVVTELLYRGYAVRALVRRLAARSVLEISGAEVAMVDLYEPASLEAGLAGCQALVHCAGYYPKSGLGFRRQLPPALASVENALAAARRAGVERVVYTSSLSAFGRPPPGRELACEEDHYQPGSTRDLYHELKFQMERHALRFSEAVVVNPTLTLGPGDRKPMVGRLVRMVAAGWLPFYINSKTNVIDVRDLATAMVNALERGRAGERYLLGGHNLTSHELLCNIALRAGRLPPAIGLPASLAKALACLAETANVYLLGRGEMYLLTAVNGLVHGQHYDCAKARRELGLRSRPITETIDDTLKWWTKPDYI